MPLDELRESARKLVAYRRRIRPPAAASLPPFIDAELGRIDVFSRDVTQAIKDLDQRLAGLGG